MTLFLVGLFFLLVNGQPNCTYQCDSPVCKAICAGKCEPASCEVQCPVGHVGCVGVYAPDCVAICAPAVGDQSVTECPICETRCQPLPAPACTGCSPLCLAPRCGWDCQVPPIGPSCPLPTCVSQCELPFSENATCPLPSSAAASQTGLFALIVASIFISIL